jgi:transketolase
VTIEDHNIIGGLGSAIAELSVEEYPVPIKRLGLQDIYPRSGNPEPLLDYYHIGVTDIVSAAQATLKRRDS